MKAYISYINNFKKVEYTLKEDFFKNDGIIEYEKFKTLKQKDRANYLMILTDNLEKTYWYIKKQLIFKGD